MSPEWRVTLADNTIGEREVSAVTEVLRSRWLSAGERTRRFEEEFARLHGAPAAVAVSSGTAALHLAVLALDLRAGDEVIMPALTFVASAATVALHGGRPVFADVRSRTDLTVDPADVARLVGPRTRAICAMHYAGFPARLAELRAIADRAGLALIEDAAHAPAVRADEGTLGTVGDIGCFSFFATKNVTTGEGGMVLARDAGLLDRIRRMRAHHLTVSTTERMRTGEAAYDVPGLGLNYRPTEIASALGLVQLDRLPIDRSRRRALVDRYRTALAGVTDLDIPFADRGGDSAHHLFAVLLPAGVDRTAVRDRLNRAGIQTSVHYPPVHRFSLYRRLAGGEPRPLPVTDAVAPRLLSLPLHARMTAADADLVASTLIAALETPPRHAGAH